MKQTRPFTSIAALFIGLLLFIAFVPDARAYEPIGQVDPDSDGLVWVLPLGSQVLSKCCYRDRDCDHVVDWVEAELAWAFRPYVVYDEGEDPEEGDEHMILYHVIPIEHQPGQKLVLRVTLVFIFQDDHTRGNDTCGSSHHGDTERLRFFVTSTDPGFQRWHISTIMWRNCHDTVNEWDASNPDPALFDWVPDTDTGLSHFPVYVAEQKHGLYPSHSRCEDCRHACR